jgi:hypothetical protein
MRKIVLGTVAVAFAVGALLAPQPANAWWRGGGWFYGPAIVVGPPVIYAPPPVIYGQPGAVYAPGQVYSPAPGYVPAGPAGQACYASAYVCPLDQPTPVGGPCSCPTNQGRAYGRAQ